MDTSTKHTDHYSSPYLDRNDSPPTPSSSGAQTPRLGANPNRASASYLSNMFSGLIRRFSSEDGQFGGHLDGSYHDDLSSPSKDGINGVFNPVKRTASPFRPPPLDPLVLHGYRDGTPQTARLLSAAVAEEIRSMVPERLRIVEDWSLVYSLEQDGASLATLYQRCRQYEGRRAGFVLVVKDQEGGVSLATLR